MATYSRRPERPRVAPLSFEVPSQENLLLVTSSPVLDDLPHLLWWNWYYATVTLVLYVCSCACRVLSAGAQPYEERNEQPEGILPEPALLCLVYLLLLFLPDGSV